MDSLISLIEKKQKLPASLDIQLSAAYGRGNNKINLVLPHIQQQDNSVDCGVFAIANLVEFCFKGTIDTDITFKSEMMREHLLKCLIKKKFEPFPRKNKSKICQKKPMTLDIYLDCSKCSLSNIYDDMISCEFCTKWFHNSCVGLDDDFRDSFIFTCDNCR